MEVFRFLFSSSGYNFKVFYLITKEGGEDGGVKWI